MANPVLALVSELAALTGRESGDLNLLAALRDASRRFRDGVGHSVHRVEDDVVYFDGSGSRSLILGAVPVESVSSVLVDGEPLAAGSYSVARRAGILRRRDGAIFPRWAEVEVTFTHGYDCSVLEAAGDEPERMPNLPVGIQAAVLEAAEIQMNVPRGVASRTVLGDTVSFGGAAVGSTQAWSDAVARYHGGGSSGRA